jgi:dTDP-glucose 4,6-dehydratase
LRGQAIPVYGKGENIRDWLYVADHAEALCAILQRGTIGQTYAIGGNNELRNIDLVRMICRLMDELNPDAQVHRHEDLITFVKDRPGHDLRYAIDAGRLREQLAWQPREDGQSGLRKTVKWYLENQSWWQRILDRTYQLQRLGVASEGR